jgi:hypothetical protein
VLIVGIVQNLARYSLVYAGYGPIKGGKLNINPVTYSLEKVKLSPCSIKHHFLKKYGVMEVYLQSFLTSTLEGSE